MSATKSGPKAQLHIEETTTKAQKEIVYDDNNCISRSCPKKTGVA